MEDSNRNFKLQTCEDFIEVLASKAAVPAALTGAIGIALGNMVGSLTVGKKTYADVEDEIIECKKEADEIAKEFLELMDKDAEAFEPLSRAYGLPKSTPEEIAEKEEIMENALNVACGVPIEIMKTCARGIDLVEVFAAKGSRIALSDAGVGATLLKSAMQGASLNVYINTKSMKDRKRAEELNQLADSLREEYEAKADRIFAEVSSRIR
jgi:formiminotetrahydrofolate cyclodeaminase